VQMLESFERTTKYKDQIEFFIAIDEGTKEEFNKWYRDIYSFKVEIVERPKTDDFSNDYYNYLANRCSGKHIIAFNDDAWMRTHHWDHKILHEVKKYGWTIYMLDIPDTARIHYNNNFPCFPCVSRRAMNTLGFLLHREVPIYPADQFTWAIYNAACRVIPIRNVLIQHDHIHESDPSKQDMMEKFRRSMKDKVLNYGMDALKLASTAAAERNLPSKLDRIWSIIQER